MYIYIYIYIYNVIDIWWISPWAPTRRCTCSSVHVWLHLNTQPPMSDKGNNIAGISTPTLCLPCRRLWKNTPPERNTHRSVSFRSIESRAAMQLPLPDGRASALIIVICVCIISELPRLPQRIAVVTAIRITADPRPPEQFDPAWGSIIAWPCKRSRTCLCQRWKTRELAKYCGFSFRHLHMQRLAKKVCLLHRRRFLLRPHGRPRRNIWYLMYIRPIYDLWYLMYNITYHAMV